MLAGSACSRKRRISAVEKSWGGIARHPVDYHEHRCPFGIC